ncbi:MAG: Bifunctional ligase/repressor BirA [Anaerolineales bacterium]|nr:Bifunctional ligase/repressor BirA [Anaerolineales bacterium]
MNQETLTELSSQLPLGEIRYFDSTGSTNDEALKWAQSGARDMSIIVADEQTMGRGRMDRPWFTPPGTALAFSLILRPTLTEKPHLSRLVGLAALSIVKPLQAFGLSPQIKWPNDILLDQRKVAGVLIELVWSGEDVVCVVIGVGINVSKRAVPGTDILRFPGTSLEDALGNIVEREKLLKDILSAFIALRPQLGSDRFMNQWGEVLAYRGRQVRVEMGGDQTVVGKLEGILSDGSLRIRDDNGKSVTVHFGDVRLRPFTDILKNKATHV